MSELFFDSFTSATNEFLQDHTPDTGTAWTFQSGNSVALRIEASTNALRVRSNTLSLVTSDDISDADQYIEATLGATANMSTNYIACRLSDVNNFIGWHVFGSGATDIRLVKKVSGTLTTLDTHQPVIGNKYKIECEGTTVKWFEDDVQIGSDITVTELSTNTLQGVIGDRSVSFADLITDYATGDIGGGGATGTIAITMSLFTSAGTGNIGEAITGTVSELMDDLIINGSGSVGDNPTGTINITMGDVSVSAAGNIGEAITGTSSILMIDATVVAAGNIGEAVSGAANIQADVFTIVGEGTFALAVTGTVNIQMNDFSIQGRESQGGGIYGAISVIPIEIMELNAEPIEVITK